MTRPRTVRQAGCIIFKAGQVVLRRSADGSLVFPKGHLEPGETEPEAARREAAEETGLEVELIRPTGEVRFGLAGEERQVRFFLARAVRELDTWPEHLSQDVVLLPREQVHESLSHDSNRALWQELAATLKESEV